MTEFDLIENLFEHRGVDSVFTIIRILTLATYIAWPLVAFLSIMAVGGKSSPGESGVKTYLVKALYLVAIAYPILFMSIVYVSEKVLLQHSYGLGVLIAVLPLALFSSAAWWLGRHSP